MRIGKISDHQLLAALALILYSILALAYFGTTGNYTHRYLGWGADPAAYIWFLNWWPWAITHGLNPFVSYYVWYPEGFNMTWAGSVPTASLLMSPITWLANAVVSFNILSLLAPALSAWTGFLLARYLTREMCAALVGGYLFGFSSYQLGQMLGHLNLDLIFVVPLLLLFVIQRIRGELSRRRFVVAFAIALLAQLGLATEILATSCLFGAITWLIFFAFSTQEERRRLWIVAVDIVLAGAIMTILAAPFLFFIFKDLGKVPPLIHPAESYSADLLNYLVPTMVTRIGGSLFVDIAKRFPGNLSEQGSYLSLPLIIILIFQFFEIRSRPYLKPLLLSILAVMLFSFGPSLHVGGVRMNVWLPWRLALHLPIIRQALPARFSMYVALASALVVALWLSKARHRWERVGCFSVAALACLLLMPNPAMVKWTNVPREQFFRPQNVISALGPDANVLILPYGQVGPSLIWQVESGMAFTQSGGYVGFTPPAELSWKVLEDLASVVKPGFENDIVAFCVTHKVRAILIGPNTRAPLASAISALHWPETKNHGVSVVRVPDPSALHFFRVEGDFWQQGTSGFMGRQITVMAHGQPMQLWISGRYRPSVLGPVEIRVVNGSEVSSYRIATQDTEPLNLPADAVVTLTASATFVPARILHNGDERALSVSIDLPPDSVLGRQR